MPGLALAYACTRYATSATRCPQAGPATVAQRLLDLVEQEPRIQDETAGRDLHRGIGADGVSVAADGVVDHGGALGQREDRDLQRQPGQQRSGFSLARIRAERHTGGMSWGLPLETLLSRRVPVRGVEPGPVTGVGRLRWGDGTVMLVVSARRGELSRVLRSLETRRSLTLESYEQPDEQSEAGPLLTLAGAVGREPVRLIVVGRDQPD